MSSNNTTRQRLTKEQRLDMRLRFLFPNNKPRLTSEIELAEIGRAVVARNKMHAFPYIEVITQDIFGRRERHFIRDENSTVAINAARKNGGAS